jgi:hypothetical protein
MYPDLISNGAVPTPLTILTDDELLFRDTIRDFAEREVRPLVREMDEAAMLRPALLEAPVRARRGWASRSLMRKEAAAAPSSTPSWR